MGRAFSTGRQGLGLRTYTGTRLCEGMARAPLSGNQSLTKKPEISGTVTENPGTQPKTTRRKRSFRPFLRWFGIGVAGLWLLAVLILVAARWIDPSTTAVHIERRLQAWIHNAPYHERYKFVPLSQISPDFQHAVIAA